MLAARAEGFLRHVINAVVCHFVVCPADTYAASKIEVMYDVIEDFAARPCQVDDVANSVGEDTVLHHVVATRENDSAIYGMCMTGITWPIWVKRCPL